MKRIIRSLLLVAVGCLATVGAAQAQPSQGDAMLALDAAFQRISGYDGTQVTTIFQSVTPGAANGGSYPFRVSMVVHTSDPGYPPNGYFGKSCVETFSNHDFRLTADGYGGWEASGAMSAYNIQCLPNPSEYQLGIPIESIEQTVAGVNGTSSSGPSGGNLTTGEWSCWGNSGLVASLFLFEDGYYTDTGGNYGTYDADLRGGAIYFSGAALDGVVGSDLMGQSFRIGNNILCEPS
jgi:hypothetical protein